jgi:predicted nucleotidyltransferase
MDTAALAAVAARHPIRLLLLHGSTVTGRTHAQSDVDLAALFESGQASRGAVAALTDDLQLAMPGLDIDLVALNHADPLLLKRVLQDCRLVYGSTRALAELRLYAFRRYQDHRRYLALERRYVSGVVNRAGAP